MPSTALLIAQTAQYRRRVLSHFKTLNEMIRMGSTPGSLVGQREAVRLSKLQFRRDYLRTLRNAAPLPLPK